jgi:uncharacterized RDD family membrane protein YckC
MKCPKCGYLGFEDHDRCRNCGYEFSLVQPAPAAPEVLIHPDVPAPGPDPDFFLGDTDDAPGGVPPATDAFLDLGRLVDGPARTVPELPLFGGRARDDAPLVRTPSRPRAPLAVRRATPEVPRARTRTPRAQMEALDLDVSPVAAHGSGGAPPAEPIEAPATPSTRVMASIVDLAIVLGIDVVVVYFTLRLCGLQANELLRLPMVPLAAFLLLLNGGYFVAFTAVGGQSIGKMALGIQVVSQESQPVTFGRATVRALVCLASALPFGLGFLALVGRNGRALHDRAARTRVTRPPWR